MTGKDRLERVPALAKHNFRNLTGSARHLALRQAWRLVDFLEGSSGEARLTVHAREGLRAVELDRHLATLRASASWKEAARSLRRAIDAASEITAPGEELIENASREDRATSLVDQSWTAGDTAAAPARRLRARLAGGSTVLIGSIVLGLWAATSLWGDEPAPRYACLALETASAGDLEAHWGHEPQSRIPRPAVSKGARPRVIRIDDPASGPVQSTWTTSTFSFAGRAERRGPGGGRTDFRLRIGGWGDTYLSLLKVPVPTNRVVQRAVLRLTVLGDDGSSRPTTMTIRAIAENWEAGSGPDDRLWWRDCPRSEVFRRHLPAPGPRDSVYEIEITDLYNEWALGQQPPYGIMLEPEHIGSWGPGRPHFSNFNTFYSTRALDPANRPTLILTY